MIYDEKLEKRPLDPLSLFYTERKLMRELSLFDFVSDDNKTFMDNLIDFQIRKEKLLAVTKIYEIKLELYKNYGVTL